MAKKKSTGNEGKITKTDLKKSVTMDSSIFDATEGEMFAGANILKIEKGEATGPFTHKSVSEGLVGKPKIDPVTKMDTRKLVKKYVADFDGKSVRMPISAGFTMKADEANLKPGDTYLIRRIDDYDTGFGGVGKGFQLKVTKRA
jgi:hypothetical protein